MAGGFPFNTRLFQIQQPDIPYVAGGGISQMQFPKVGLLANVLLQTSLTYGAGGGPANALGKGAAINRVRVTVNSGIDLFNFSCPGYHFLLRETLDSEYVDPVGQSDARAAFAAGAANLDMFIPVQVNPRDAIGLIMLQNEQTTLQLTVDWLPETSLDGAGTTITGNMTPYLELFTVPIDPADLPRLDILHQILEDSQAISAAGDFTYNIPRANVYLQLLHGAGIGAAGSDNWSQYRMRVNQSQYLYSSDVGYWDMVARRYRGRARVAGTIPIDLMAPSGLGTYGVSRDLFNSALVTDIASIITALAAGTLYTIRRQLVPMTA